ncbi:dienelactone hydrolase family protein [Halorubrum gandharaense]
MTRTLTDVDGPHGEAPLAVAGAPAAASEAALVALHGRGGTPEGLLRLLEEWTPAGVTLLAPGARRSSWLPAGHDAPVADLEPALSSAVDCVASTLDAAAAVGDAGIPADRTMLLGVSQGGCVLAEFLRRRPRRFGGAFLVSAALPGATPSERSVEGDLAGTPVALDATEADPYVSPERVRGTATVLAAGGAAVDCRIEPGDAHGLSDETGERMGDALATMVGVASEGGSE